MAGVIESTEYKPSFIDPEELKKMIEPEELRKMGMEEKQF